MTRGTRLVVARMVEHQGGYVPVPVREGRVLGHPVGDADRVWVEWLWGDKQGRRQLLRVEEVRRWVWHAN